MARTQTKDRGIVQLNRTTYEIRVRATCPRTGRRKEVRREQECSLKEARALQQQWRAELEASLDAEAVTRVRLKDFVPSWLRGRIAADELKPSSASKIASVYDLHIATSPIANLFVDDIKVADVRRWLDEQRDKKFAAGKGTVHTRKGPKDRSFAKGTVLGYYRVLKTIITAATGEAGVVNPCAAIKAPQKGVGRKNFLAAEELQRVLEHVRTHSPEWYPAVLLDAFTGLRWGELSALRWDDIDEAQGVIRVVRGNWKGQVINSTKTGEEGEAKVVPLLPVVAEELREHRRRMIAAQHPGLQAGWIFPTREGGLHKGTPLGGEDGVITRACAAVSTERRITPHGLRHTANDLLRRVATGEVVRAIVGHSTEQMTHHYSHVDETEKRRAVARAFEVVTGGKGVPAGVPAGAP